MKIREVLAASRSVFVYARALLRISLREDVKVDEILYVRNGLMNAVGSLRRSVASTSKLEAVAARKIAESAERELRTMRNRLSERVVAKEQIRVGEIVAELDRVVKHLATALGNGPTPA